MLESLVATILNRFLGSYVENFDPKQLNIGIWSGDVKLSNLRLKKDALDKLELPIDVKFGHLGNLILQIPWSNLRGKPVKVTIEDVYLLAAPIIQENYNFEEELKRELSLKFKRLADLELREKAKPTSSISDEDVAKNESFTESLVTKVVDNLQFVIKKIHIRYEDINKVFTDNPYALGITLDELSAVSTNESWLPAFISDSGSLTHKLLTLKSLCCYWNTDSTSIYDEDPDKLLFKFKESIIDEENLSEFSDYTQFILRPVSGTGHLTVNKAGTTETQPHFKTEVFFEEFSVDLDSEQYRDILLSGSKFHWYNKTHKFKRFKPTVPLEGNAKEWFRYAANSVLNEIHEKNYRRSWDFLRERRDDRKAYIRLWKQKLQLPDVQQNLKQPSHQELVDLEEKLAYEDIKFFRSLAKSELRKDRLAAAESSELKAPEQPHQPAANSWASWWRGSKTTETVTEGEDKIVMTEEQRQEFFQAIEFDESQALKEAIDVPRDRVNFEIIAELRKGGFTVKNRATKKDLAKVIFEGCAAQHYQRPDSFLSTFTLQEFKVEDGTETTLYKNVVSVKPFGADLEDQDDDEPFFKVSFENNPLDGSADSSLYAKLRSMTIFHHVDFINEIVKFFRPPQAHLDTIYAIMNAAEATVEGLTTQTRLGLEAIWAEHKTINAKLDLQAPLIILPLDPQNWSSPCAVIDAGHISVVSDLTDKDKAEEIKALSPEEYSKIDIKELNKLMFDRFNVHLQDTQILIGPTIKSTIAQLHNRKDSSSLILDKLDMKILLELSILPQVPHLPRVRTTASLSKFVAKMNDYQYKIFMQLVNKAIPDFNFGEEPEEITVPFSTSDGLSPITEIAQDDSSDSESDTVATQEQLHKAFQDELKKQHQFEFFFDVNQVHLSLSKCKDGETMEADPIVDLLAEKFHLEFFKTATDIHVDLSLGTFNIEDMLEKSGPSEFRKLISSNNFTEFEKVDAAKDIFKLNYQRSQRIVNLDGKEIEVFDQDVDLDLSALKVIGTRKSLLTILNFILTTFTDPNPPEVPADALRHNDASQIELSPQQIRVNVNLDSIIIVLNDDGIKLATLQLSTAHFSVLVLPEKLRVYSKLGALTLHDEVNEGSSRDSLIRKLLSFDGDELAEFTYETFDLAANTLDYQSSLSFKAGSLRVNFVEEPFGKIFNFLNNFLKMKSFYDSARDAAFNQVKLQNQNMIFDITIETPIIVFPKLVDFDADTYDNITCYLGELKASNKFIKESTGFSSEIVCGLHSARMTSVFHNNGGSQFLEIIDNLDINFNVDNYEFATDRPKSAIAGHLTNVNADLTELQVNYLYCLSQTISTAFTYDDRKSLSEIEDAALNANKVIAPDATYSATQEQIIQSTSASQVLSNPNGIKIDFSFSIPGVSLIIHDKTRGVESLDSTGISKFSLLDIGFRFVQKESSEYDADVHFGSFTVEDVRKVKDNKFTEIIPKSSGTEHQFCASVSATNIGEHGSTVVMLKLTNLKVILALDYIFAMKSFTDTAFKLPYELRPKQESHSDDEMSIDQVSRDSDFEPQQQQAPPSKLGFTLNIIDTSLILLADPTSKSSEAIVFKIEQLLASKQNISTASANNVGMFLCKMDSYEENRIRIIDDFSSSITIDDRGSTNENFLTSIQIAIEPLVMRVSLNDIRLAVSIFNKASELYKEGKPEDGEGEDEPEAYNNFTKEFRKKLSKYAPSIVTSLSGAGSKRLTKHEVDIIIKAENLTADVEGFRLVLIGNVHELPVLDISVNPFQVTAKNWSTDLEADTNFESSINIFNYAKSSWEPLVEPWPLDIHVSRTIDDTAKLVVDFISRKLAEITVSSRSIALLSQVLSSISGEGDVKGRGVIKPYKILNQTGFDIKVWADSDETPTKFTIQDGEEITWQFEDWRKIRENLDTNNERDVLGVEMLGSGYDTLRRISVNGEGEDIHMLTPPLSGFHNRLISETSLGDDNVKTITLKSTITIENQTQVPISIKGSKQFTVLPGFSRAVPINEVYETGFIVKPQIQVPFQWSENSLHWRRLSKGPISIRCPCEDPEDSTSFYFQAVANFDKSEPLTKVYPHMKIVLSAPLEIENLLPYDISYRLYDRSAKRDWKNNLKKGNVSPVHVVKLEHFLLLSVQPKDSGFSKSDFAIINSPDNSEFKRENRLCLKHEDGQQLHLGIHYSSRDKKGFGTRVVIYSPYVILNRTGKDVLVSEKYNVLQSKYHNDPDELKTSLPKMFSFEEMHDVGSRALVKVGHSQWSRPVSFETIGQTSEISVQIPDKKSEINIGATVKEGEGKYKLSKVITFVPRFIVRNNFSEDVEVLDVGSTDPLHLAPGKLEALYNLPRIFNKQVQLRFPGSQTWSSKFNINDVGQIYLKVLKQGVGHILLKIDVLLEEATLFINIEDANNHWPISVHNFSDQEFIFYQKNPYVNERDEVIDSDAKTFKPIYYKIPPKSVMPYAWDFPAGLIKELVLRAGGRERHVQLSEIGNLRPMKIPNSGKIVDLNVVADGPTQSLVITNYDPTVSFYKLQENAQTASSLSINNSDKFKPAEEDSDISTQILFKFEGIGISLINTRLQELCYITARGIEFRLNDSDLYQTATWKLKWLQIDNQLFGGIYPIIVYPTVVPQSVKEMENHPAFSGSVSRVKDESHGVLYIKYATILLQEMSLEIDEDFLFALLEFSKIPGASWNKESQDKLCDESITLPGPYISPNNSDVYFEVLHIQPTQLNLSFVRTERVNVEDKTTSQNAIMFFLNILTMAIGNINDAPIRMNALMIENVRVPIPTLIQHIQTHYGQNFFYQIHKVLGSADVIGNPVGLFNNISSGFMDIFYEPYQGLVMNDRPQELGITLAKGGLSFLKKSVFGFSDSFAKVSGSISKGLTVATLDKDFQERRRLKQRRNKPKHAIYGFSNGATSFVDGIASGISGVALAPVQGASKEGASGFLKGIGKGLIGLPTKSAIGIFDLVNQVSEGIRNTTTAFDSDGIDKVRLPRFIDHNGIVKIFNERESQGQYWLKTASGGQYFNDEYLAHVVLPGDDMAVVVTFKRILLISTSSDEVKWAIEFDQVKSITQEKTGIKIGLINSKQGPFIPIPDISSRKFLYRNIGVAVNEYNKLCQVVL